MLLHRQLDSSLLRQKELEQQSLQLRHRLSEMELSQQFRQGEATLEAPLLPPSLGLLLPPPADPRPEMDRLLGL